MRAERTEAKLIIVFKTSQHRPRNEHRLIINALQHCTVIIRGGHVGWGGIVCVLGVKKTKKTQCVCAGAAFLLAAADGVKRQQPY